MGTDLTTLEAGLDPAQQRLALTLLAHRLAMMTARSVLQAQPAPRLAGDPTLEARFLSALPFELTKPSAASTRSSPPIWIEPSPCFGSSRATWGRESRWSLRWRSFAP